MESPNINSAIRQTPVNFSPNGTATSTAIETKDQESIAQNTDVIDIPESFLQSAINGNFSIAEKIKICAAFGSDYFINDLPMSLRPCFQTKATRDATYKTVCYILGKMHRDFLQPKVPVNDDAKAIDNFSEALNYGCQQASEALNDMYLAGRGLLCKNRQAETFLLKLVMEQANPLAAYQLSVFYEGVGEYKQAWLFLQTAADGKNPEALCRLARLYLEPDKCPFAIILNQSAQHIGFMGIKQSDTKAEMYFTLAAQAGSKEATVRLENMYFDGRGVNARGYFEIGIEQKKPSAFYGLAILYEKGIVVEKDVQRASSLFKQAEMEGYSDAHYRLAGLALQKNESFENCSNTSIAYSHLMKAADLGHAKAAFTVGKKLIDEGWAGKSDWNQACTNGRKYLTIADEQKYPGAAYQLASLNLKTGGDTNEAVQLLMQAIRAGDLDAYCLLGELYLVGIGEEENTLIRQSYQQAKDLLTIAADRGHAKAAHLLTRFYPPGKKFDVEWQDPDSTVYEDVAHKRHINGEDTKGWYLPINLADPTLYNNYCRSQKSTGFDRPLQYFLEKNIPKLYQYLTIAAEGNIPQASYRLAKFLEKDKWGDASQLDALDRGQKIEACYKKAADFGHQEAALALYDMYNERDYSWSVEPPFNDPKEEAKKYGAIAEGSPMILVTEKNIPQILAAAIEVFIQMRCIKQESYIDLAVTLGALNRI